MQAGNKQGDLRDEGDSLQHVAVQFRDEISQRSADRLAGGGLSKIHAGRLDKKWKSVSGKGIILNVGRYK